MTDQLQADRDEIAEMCGWKRWNEEGDGIDHDDAQGWYRRSKTLVDPDHPIPACLNFVSRVWPEGLSWWRSDGRWSGGRKYVSLVLRIIDSGDELADRMTLLLKVLKWLRDNERPAFDAACEKIRKEI